MSRFPAEVKAHIWIYGGLSTPYNAFILVAGETCRLILHIKRHSSHNLVLKNGSILTAKVMAGFSTEYIQDLVCDENPKAAPTALENVVGIKLVANRSGICAIKLLSANGEADWISKTPGTGRPWHGMNEALPPYLRRTHNVS